MKHPIIGKEAIKHVVEIMRSGELSGFKANQEGHRGGRFVRWLEAEFMAYFDVKHAVSFNSATSALHAACVACGVKSGDEVIVPTYTFSASASCVLMAGGTPVFADIEPNTYCLNPYEVGWRISKKTKAIIPVHLHGHPAEMAEILSRARRYQAYVIEDASQAIGATYRGRYVGTLGDCGVFSFNQSKPISCGEGGMLITNDDKIAEIARLVRNHGETQGDVLGYNYRMCEIEAAIALEQFQNLDKMNEHRIKLANYLTEALSGIEGLTPPIIYPDCKHVYYTYPVRVDENILGISRNELQFSLAAKGIYFGIGGQKPLHFYSLYGGYEGQFPEAERAGREVMFTDRLRYPATLDDVKQIVQAIYDII